MDGPKRQRPHMAGTGKRLAGETFTQKLTTPASFWKGWGGPASMCPPVHRKPSTPPDTWWKPERGRA